MEEVVELLMVVVTELFGLVVEDVDVDEDEDELELE
tara:strand:+ start:118 stop:225 length:108 start_codon:yes stop_codon:yes gene_type:complete